eukprot:g2155.t1
MMEPSRDIAVLFDDLAHSFGFRVVESPDSAVVLSVAGVAATAGLRAGDVMVSFFFSLSGADPMPVAGTSSHDVMQMIADAKLAATQAKSKGGLFKKKKDKEKPTVTITFRRPASMSYTCIFDEHPEGMPLGLETSGSQVIFAEGMAREMGVAAGDYVHLVDDLLVGTRLPTVDVPHPRPPTTDDLSAEVAGRVKKAGFPVKITFRSQLAGEEEAKGGSKGGPSAPSMPSLPAAAAAAAGGSMVIPDASVVPGCRHAFITIKPNPVGDGTQFETQEQLLDRVNRTIVEAGLVVTSIETVSECVFVKLCAHVSKHTEGTHSIRVPTAGQPINVQHFRIWYDANLPQNQTENVKRLHLENKWILKNAERRERALVKQIGGEGRMVMDMSDAMSYVKGHMNANEPDCKVM